MKYNLHMPIPLLRGAKTLFLIFTILSILWSNYAAWNSEFIGPQHNAYTAAIFRQDNYDIPPLVLRMQQARTFDGTKSYWHEDYTPGVPFYRPLSLTWFWLQYQWIGTDRYNGWIAVSIALEIIFCILLAVLVLRLTGSSTAPLFALLIFAGTRTVSPIAPVAYFFQFLDSAAALTTVAAWKDQPTLLSDIAVVSSMILAYYKKWLPGLLTVVVGILFKESSWIAFALTFLMLVLCGKLRDIPKWVYVGAVVSMAIPILARYLSGMGLIGGYRVGHNYGWKTRYITAVSGSYFSCFLWGTWPAALFATSLYGVVCWKRMHLYARLALVVLFLCAAGAANMILDSISFTTAVTMLLDPSLELHTVIICYFFVMAVGLLWQQNDLGKIALLFVVLSLIAALPYVAALQVNIHQLNLCYAFQSAAVGIAWAAGGRKFADWLEKLRHRQGGLTEASA
jgi:hypothetical protein